MIRQTQVKLLVMQVNSFAVTCIVANLKIKNEYFTFTLLNPNIEHKIRHILTFRSDKLFTHSELWRQLQKWNVNLAMCRLVYYSLFASWGVVFLKHSGYFCPNNRLSGKIRWRVSSILNYTLLMIQIPIKNYRSQIPRHWLPMMILSTMKMENAKTGQNSCSTYIYIYTHSGVLRRE